jgi:hypothetical protein
MVDEIDYTRGDGEAEAFAAAALRKNKGVDADDRSVHIDQRAAAVAGVDGSVGLDVGERLARIGLASHGADHSHGDRILEAFGTADGEDELANTRALGKQGKRGKVFFVDLEQGEVGFFVNSDEARFEDVALAYGDSPAGIARQGQRHTDALCTFDDVSVGDDVAIGIDNHSRADRLLAHDERGLSAILFVKRTVAGDENLNYRGRNFGGEGFKGVVELGQGLGGGGGLFFFCGGSWGGSLLGGLCWQGYRCGQN